MALQKKIETQYGVDAEYHKIALTNINWHDHRAHIEMIGFVSQEDREAGKSPICSRVFDWAGEDFTLDYEGNVIEQAYLKIKESKLDEEGNETNEFYNSLDI